MSVPAGFDATPVVNETVITVADLETWTQQPAGSLTGNTWAQECVWAASLVVREAGSLTWAVGTVPQRAALIAKVLAADCFTNPRGLKTDTTGPISETRVDAAVRRMVLSDDEKKLLAQLANKPDPTAESGGLWVLPTETGLEGEIIADVYVTDQSDSDWMLPWALLGDHLYPEEW